MWNITLKYKIISLWPTSMTTRIETILIFFRMHAARSLWPTSMTTRIETQLLSKVLEKNLFFMTNFHDNKDWNNVQVVIDIKPCKTLWPTSMTTRIETTCPGWKRSDSCIFMTNFHDNKDWNWETKGGGNLPPLSLWPTSMTTRIETERTKKRIWKRNRSLWPTSMTTRIETFYLFQDNPYQVFFMTNFHDNKDWNDDSIHSLHLERRDFMTNFHDNKDWNKDNGFNCPWKIHLYDQLPWQQGLKQGDSNDRKRI